MRLNRIIFKALMLGIGLAVGILLIAKVCYEKSFDTCYSDSDRIYKIKVIYTMQDEGKEYSQVSGAVAPGFKQYVPGVETATRYTYVWNSDKFSDENNNKIEASLIAADTSFFDVFDTEILVGEPKKILSKHSSIMISESLAEKMGGVSNVVGKIISNEESPGFEMHIEGVFKDFPHGSSVDKDILLSMESLNKQSTQNWFGNDAYRGYVKLSEGTDPDMLAPAIKAMQEKNNPPELRRMIENSGIEMRYFLVPLVGEHTSSKQMKNMLIILSVVAVLLIAISLLNYFLMSVSAMAKRAKEMGVRKCYGALSGNIYSIMIKETVVDILAAMFVGSIVILAMRPVIEDIVGVPLEALFVKQTYVAIITVVLSVFLVSAFGQGYIYSKIPAWAAIKRYSENKRIWKLTLLFVQTVICAFLLALTFIISAQYKKAINDKPGYEYQNLLWTVLTGTDKSVHQGIIDELKTLHGVVDVQMSDCHPLEYSSGNNVFLPDGERMDLFNIADQYEGTAGLFELLEIPFVEGRYPQNHTEVAVSESFVEEMMEFQDWSDGAVGKVICITEHSQTSDIVFTVSGVYKDYRINTLTYQDARSSVKFYGEVGKDYMPFMAIKVNEVSNEIITETQEIIQSRIENKEVEVKAYKDSMREAYSEERRMKNTVTIGCFISIIIALFGLFAYVRDESQRRSKEMALRRINGSTIREIIEIYVYEILKLSVVAILIGNIGAYFTASVWLENFSEKVALSAEYFIVADLIIITLVVGAVIINSIRIASANPVESLKNE